MKLAVSARWLDAAKQALGCRSDYALAKELGLSFQRVSNYRVGRNGFDDDMAIRIAQICHVPPGVILAELMAERSKTPALQRVWLEVSRNVAQHGKAASIGAVILSACMLPGPDSDPLAFSSVVTQVADSGAVQVCILCKASEAGILAAGQPSTVILVTMTLLLLFTIRLRAFRPS